MRLEGKHNYFKELAHCIKCFNNVIKTLAEHYQHYACYNMSCEDTFDQETSIGPSKYIAMYTKLIVQVKTNQNYHYNT